MTDEELIEKYIVEEGSDREGPAIQVEDDSECPLVYFVGYVEGKGYADAVSNIMVNPYLILTRDQAQAVWAYISKYTSKMLNLLESSN